MVHICSVNSLYQENLIRYYICLKTSRDSKNSHKGAADICIEIFDLECFPHQFCFLFKKNLQRSGKIVKLGFSFGEQSPLHFLPENIIKRCILAGKNLYNFFSAFFRHFFQGGIRRKCLIFKSSPIILPPYPLIFRDKVKRAHKKLLILTGREIASFCCVCTKGIKQEL